MKNKELNNIMESELNKLFKTDYWGTEEQIENEQFIKKVSKTLPKYNETIEEWYLRIFDNTK